MQSYIREHTVGGIINGAFRIYFQHFTTIILAFFIPVLPFNLLQVVATSENLYGLLIVSVILGTMAGLLAFSAITLIISDFCVGNKASIVRAYKRVLGALIFKLLATNLLQMLAIIVGIIPALIAFNLLATDLLQMLAIIVVIISALIAIAWFLFGSIIVVLEGTWGVEALKRSKNLGSTKHWRNIGVFLILSLVGIVFGGIAGAIMGAIAPNAVGQIGFQIMIVILQLLVTPLSLIAIVLLYYDLRVRKEAYNLEALAEDLKF